MNREQLIEKLSRDLPPVKRPPSLASSLALWSVSAWLIVIAATVLTGPFRPGFTGQLIQSPQYLIESLMGFGVGVLSVFMALKLAIPAPGTAGSRVGPALALAALWVGAYVLGLWLPAIEPSMAGKRPHCFVETLVFSVPTMALGFMILRRYAVLRRRWAGALVGVVAASIPGLIMQFACMYDPLHTLTLHLSPMAAAAVAGALLAEYVLPEI